MVPTNTGLFLRGLKLCGESRTQQELLVSKMKFGVTMHFSEIIKLQFRKKMSYIACILRHFIIILA